MPVLVIHVSSNFAFVQLCLQLVKLYNLNIFPSKVRAVMMECSLVQSRGKKFYSELFLHTVHVYDYQVSEPFFFL